MFKPLSSSKLAPRPKRRRRSLLAVSAVVALGLAATACGGDDDGSAAPTTAPTTEVSADDAEAPADDATTGEDEAVSVVLLIGGPATDGGFYQAMVDGLQEAAAEDGNVEVTIRERLAAGGDAALEDAVREAAASGSFDLIVAHGFDLVPAIARFAPDFPDQAFATSLPVEGTPENANVYLSIFEEIGFNAGFLVAQGTSAGRVGLIGGPGAPFELAAEAGFRQAVEQFAPGTEIEVVYTGTFEDPQLAQEAAQQMIASGVDSIYNQQAAGQSGVYTACRAAATPVNCFGNSRYSEAVAPDVVLASTVSNFGVLLPVWVERIRAGEWIVGPDFLTLQNDGTIITDATDAGNERLPGLQDAIDEYRAAIDAGEIVVEPAG